MESLERIPPINFFIALKSTLFGIELPLCIMLPLSNLSLSLGFLNIDFTFIYRLERLRLGDLHFMSNCGLYGIFIIGLSLIKRFLLTMSALICLSITFLGGQNRLLAMQHLLFNTLVSSWVVLCQV